MKMQDGVPRRIVVHASGFVFHPHALCATVPLF
jgi:DNA polymerase III alpha subunit